MFLNRSNSLETTGSRRSSRVFQLHRLALGQSLDCPSPSASTADSRKLNLQCIESAVDIAVHVLTALEQDRILRRFLVVPVDLPTGAFLDQLDDRTGSRRGSPELGQMTRIQRLCQS